MGLLEDFRRAVRLVLGLSPTDDLPIIDRLAFYRAEVKSASSDGKTVDVAPEDKRVDGHQGVPLLVGIPGAVAVVQPGAIVHLGWERGDPSRPIAVPLWEAGASVTKLILKATAIYIGDESGAEKVVTETDIASIKTAISGAAVVAQDGGASFKAAIIAAWPAAVGSSKIKAVR